ncbi:MAG: Rieske 2Fe-2S domain-containing protein [Alphaproteobacteria bacterium]|nr:Rieske 2Fe-2S domain-containing protein [Alphaproteobacteria bacterium]
MLESASMTEGTMDAAAKVEAPLSLPASWYSDPALWQKERRSIYGASWNLIARADQLASAGSYVAHVVAGWPVFVLRGRDGQLRAFHNVCRHRAAPIVEDGAGRADVLRCRYHGWVYDQDGGLRKTPGFGADIDFAELGLIPVRVESWRGLVFVCLDEMTPPLAQWLGSLTERAQGYPLERMRFHEVLVIDLGVNWKTYGDNYAEGYHVPTIHPALNRAIRMDTYEVECAVAEGVQVHRAAAAGGGTSGLWLWKFPGLLLNIYDWGMRIVRLEPLDHARSQLVYWYMFTDDSPATRTKRDDMMNWSLTIVQEDKQICREVQRNLDAGIYDRGRLSPVLETGVIQFQDWVRARLATGPARSF